MTRKPVQIVMTPETLPLEAVEDAPPVTAFRPLKPFELG